MPTEASQRTQQAQAQVQEILHLPPLSPIARELLVELGREEIEIPPLAQVIERDPGLTARLIGVANSAYFSQREPIYDVTTAIIRVLGLNLVKSLALGIALSAPFDTSACPVFELDRYWYVAVQTATLAGQLAPQAQLEPDANDYLFLAGLLHNIGELVLMHCFPDRACEAWELSRQSPDSSLRAYQRDLLALDAAEAGVALARKWHLPQRVVDVIGHYQDPDHRGEDWRSIRLVGYCSELVNANYCSPGQTPEEPELTQGNVLCLPENAVIAALKRLQSKNEQTMALARALADGD